MFAPPAMEVMELLPWIARNYLDSFALLTALLVCRAARRSPAWKQLAANARRTFEEANQHLRRAVAAGDLVLPGCCDPTDMRMDAAIFLVNPSRPALPQPRRGACVAVTRQSAQC